MKTGVKLLLPLIVFALFSLAPHKILAHPGNTASDGCHYCRTNCAKWGEIEGARHCHGGGSVTPVIPVSTPRPTATPTKSPSPTPTPTPEPTETPTPTPESTNTPVPEVKGESVEEENHEPASATDVGIGLSFLGAMVGTPVWIGKKLLRRLRG